MTCRPAASALVPALAIALAAVWTTPAAGDAPLSAIEWLEQALTSPQSLSPQPPGTGEGPIIITEDIDVRPLSAPMMDRTGLFAAADAGLPKTLWAATPASEVAARIAALPTDMIPVAQMLTSRLLLAEFDPPLSDAEGDTGALLMARLDKLIEMGALEQASQLIDAAPAKTAGLMRRAFDIALLLGEENRACDWGAGQILAAGGHGARIFCLARQGHWQAAMTALTSARALELLEPDEAVLLQRFLEEEEAVILVPPPAQTSPMGWRIREALGEGVSTASLPLMFAHADLRGTGGWRAQLEAAERLTRAGVMQPNRLLGLYTQRRPAASGGIWDRVRAVQELDQALASSDASAVQMALATLWPLAVDTELEVSVARMFAERMQELALPIEGDPVAWRVLALGLPDADLSSAQGSHSTEVRFVAAVLRGDNALESFATGDPRARAVASGLDKATAPPDEIQQHLADGAQGLVLLDALEALSRGMGGDLRAISEGLAGLRALGLDEVARRAAVELMLLDRRG